MHMSGHNPFLVFLKPIYRTISHYGVTRFASCINKQPFSNSKPTQFVDLAGGPPQIHATRKYYLPTHASPH